MGIHLAYHESRANRVIHGACIPFELFAIVLLLSQVRIAGLPFALIALAFVGIVYLRTDLLIGAAMIALLLGLTLAAHVTSPVPSIAAVALSVAIFATTFLIQLRVGHGIYEAGVDNTDCNLGEFWETKNPVPLLLVFYFHLAHLILSLGYRPELKAQVEDVRTAELAALRSRAGACMMAGGSRSVVPGKSA